MSRFDAAAARRWLTDAVETLAGERGKIDDLNVFPVADADTGTNMYFTLRSGMGAVRDLPADAPQDRVLGACAAGAMRGARGNSGLILSVALHGFALAYRDAVAGRGDAAELAAALREANARAWSSVTEPVEGTMLTVLAQAAAAASGALPGNTSGALPGDTASGDTSGDDASGDTNGDDASVRVMTCCVDAARQALRATEGQLGALARAHVVDAGGVGVLRLLESLARSVGAPVRGEALEYTRAVTFAETDYGYEIIGELAAADTQRLTADLTRLGGTSMVVAGRDDDAATLHVHVPDRASAHGGVEAIGRYGTIRRVRISSLVAGHGRDADETPGLVAVSDAGGLTSTFAFAGAEVLPGGADPTTIGRRLRETIESLGNRDVVVLPNSPITLAVALDVQARDTIIDGRIRVIPSRSDVQSLAAVAVFDGAAGFDALAAAMTDAATATRHGAVLNAGAAGRNATVGAWHAGDVLGRVDAAVRIRGDSIEDVARAVLAELARDGAELVTFVTGRSCPSGLVETLAGEHSDVEVTVLGGGPADTALLIGVE